MTPGEIGTHSSRRRARTAAGAAVLAAAAALAYGNSFFGPFVFDDQDSILANASIRHLGDLARVLRPPVASGLTVGGRPLLNLSLAVNYAISGTRVWSYHALNLAVHLCAGLALFGIVRRTVERLGWVRADLLGLAVALLWMVHPLQTEAVTYTVQRAESLMGLFYLLTIYGFVRGATGGKIWLGLSWFACLGGMATKEVMVSAPIMVFLFDRAFFAGSWREAWRSRQRYYLGLAATWFALAYLVLATGGNRGGSSGFGAGVPWGAYMLTQGPAVLRYLRLAFWPHPLVFYYTARWVHGPAAWTETLLVALLALGACYGLWKNRGWGFLGAWFFAILAPTSLIPGPGQTVAEHRMYLPLAAVLLAALGALWSALHGKAGRGALMAGSLAAAGLFCFLTRSRNRVYASEIGLWTDTVARSPDNPYAQNSLGSALYRAGRLADARQCLARSIRLKPDFADAYVNLGDVSRAEGKVDEARTDFYQALRFKPDDADACNNLGNVLKSEGRAQEAIGFYQRALRLKQDDAEAWNDLGTVLTETGRASEAINAFQRALELRPDYAQADYNLGLVLAGSGRLPQAMDQYRAAIRLSPGLVEAHLNLGVALAQSGQLAEAAEQFETALRLRPDYAPARDNLARVRVQQAQTQP